MPGRKIPLPAPFGGGNGARGGAFRAPIRSRAQPPAIAPVFPVPFAAAMRPLRNATLPMRKKNIAGRGTAGGPGC